MSLYFWIFSLVLLSAGSFAQPALVQIKEAAEAGDPKAQLQLANRYSAQFEYTTAESWLKKAAQSGDPECLASLGTFYMIDRYDMPSKVKISKNSTNAVFLFSLAAYQGYKPAQHDLAIRCFEGNGTKRDLVRAYQMFRLSDIPPFSNLYLNKAILEMSKEQIAEGNKLVAGFKPKTFAEVLNTMLLVNLNLVGVMGAAGQKIAIINDQMFEPKQSSEMNIKGFSVRLKCESIDGKAVVVSFDGRTNRLVMH